jgi:hypothetical protein
MPRVAGDGLVPCARTLVMRQRKSGCFLLRVL